MSIVAIRPKIYETETAKLKELFDQRKTLNTQLAAVDKQIFSEALTTPGYAFLKGITGGGNTPTGIIEANYIAYELNAYTLDQRLVKKDERVLTKGFKPTAADRIAQLGEKTINSLLNGKALSAEEKRKLVVAMLPAGILSTEPAATGPVEDDDDGRPF